MPAPPAPSGVYHRLNTPINRNVMRSDVCCLYRVVVLFDSRSQNLRSALHESTSIFLHLTWPHKVACVAECGLCNSCCQPAFAFSRRLCSSKLLVCVNTSQHVMITYFTPESTVRLCPAPRKYNRADAQTHSCSKDNY